MLLNIVQRIKNLQCKIILMTFEKNYQNTHTQSVYGVLPSADSPRK